MSENVSHGYCMRPNRSSFTFMHSYAVSWNRSWRIFPVYPGKTSLFAVFAAESRSARFSGARKNSYVKFISSATYTGIKISFYKRLSCTYLVIFWMRWRCSTLNHHRKYFTYIKIDLDVYLDEVQYEQLFLYLRFLIAVFAALEKSQRSWKSPRSWVHFRIRTDRCLKRIVLWPLSLSNLAAKTGRIIQSQCVTATQTKKHGRCRAGIPLEQERYGRDWYYHWGSCRHSLRQRRKPVDD